MPAILDSFLRFPTREEYVSDEGLENLKFHKYSAVDKSWIANNVMRHYWDFATTLFPLWMAPNLITIIGLSAIIINLIIALIYIPMFTDVGSEWPIPSWVYFSIAFGMWFYSTCDNVDGKQARRTGSSTPLGELMDHGIDSLNCALGTLIHSAGVSLGYTDHLLALYFLAASNFFFSTWESFHTGTLYLSYVNGPTEGLIFATLQLILSGIYGPGIYRSKVYDIVPYRYHELMSWMIPTSWTIIDLMLYPSMLLMFLTVVPGCLYKVYRVTNERGGHGAALITAQLLPILVFFLGGFLWIKSPVSSILGTKNTVVFVLASGFTFAEISTVIILAHMTRSHFPNMWKLVVPLAAGGFVMGVPALILVNVVDFVFGPGTRIGIAVRWTVHLCEIIYLYAYLAYALITYSHWAYHVVTSFCRKLRIRPFSLRPLDSSEDETLEKSSK